MPATSHVAPFNRGTLAQTMVEFSRLSDDALKLRRQLRQRRDSLRLTLESCRYAIRRGLTIEDVRRRLPNWTDHPILVSDSKDGCCCSVWDFTPPDVRTPPLRLTFLNHRLVILGPTRHPPMSRSQHPLATVQQSTYPDRFRRAQRPLTIRPQ